MTKRFVNQYCIHCLKYFENLTRDHIFPESWYPDSTPQNEEKWVAPSCLNCNNKLGKIEEDAYKKLALSVSKDDIAMSGVPEKLARLYNPLTAKDERDKNRKISNIKKIIPDIIRPDNIPINAFMKNCGSKEGDTGKSYAIYVPFQILNSFADKVIRGLEFKIRNKLIDSDIRKIECVYSSVGIENIASTQIRELSNILNTNGIKVDRGPGFVVRHAVEFDTSLYHITIWGKIEIWGSVSNK